MNRRELIASSTAAAALTAACSTLPRTANATMPQAPVAKKIPVVIEQLGRTRTDDYHWMKDDNWQAVLRDPTLIKADVKEHLTAENAYREAMMASTVPLQTQMFEEMKGRIKQDESSVPIPDGEWEYYVEYRTGEQHPRYMRKGRGPYNLFDLDYVPEGGVRPPEELLDANALAVGKAYSEVSAVQHSRDYKLFGYAEDAQGSEVHQIYVKDLTTGQVLPDPIQSATGNFTFSPDSQWIFWTNRDDNGRPDKIFRRPARGGETTLVYEEVDEGMFISVGLSSDHSMILISISNQETSETRYIASDEPEATPKVLEPRREGVIYDADFAMFRWLIRTNADGAADFKIVDAPDDNPGKAQWRDMVPHRPGRFIEGFQPYGSFLVWQERANANTRIQILIYPGGTRSYPVGTPVPPFGSDGDLREIGVSEPAYSLSLSTPLEFGGYTFRYNYNSPSTPTSTYDYIAATGARTLRKVQEVPSGHNPADYVVERLNAPASDGELVPVTILRRKDTPVNGSAPLLLYGYGSYGIPMPASFSTNRLSLVNRGWIYAIAHIRGGSDKGWNWFLSARKFTKKNTFTDFIAAAEHLISTGHGKAGHIVAHGGSAGGLLMGAVNNMRPDLWAGVIGDVPFVDVINTMSDTSLPLTPPEWPEWGNPIEDADAYDYMMSYSPYDQVRPQAYPAVLATGGLSDPRVTYWEPEKWVARLRPATTSGKPVLLKINMEAGHGGASGRFDYLKEVALVYAFAIWAIDRGWEAA